VVLEYKYLGVIFDEALKFDSQMIKILEKIERGMKIVNTLQWKGSNIWQLFYAWMTYVVPHFSYGSLVFMPH